MSSLLSPRRGGSGLASISSPCLRVRTPAKSKEPLRNSPQLRQASPPRSPNASSKRGHFFSPDAGSNKRPPITPFKDECAAAAQHSITEVKQFSDAEQPNGPKKWTLEDFEIGKPLGRGKFGNVYAAKEKVSGVVVALKVMSKSPMLVEGAETSLQREVALHSRLVHPNILRMAGYFHNPKSCFIMLEYASGGDLFRELQKHKSGALDERLAAKYMCELLSAVAHLHRCSVIHRDIKPENCLLDSGNVLKLADLGGAVHALPPYDVRHTLCGTPEYLAPEVLAGSGYKAPVDSWACGVLMYELFYGASPFRDRENDRIYANITSFQGLAYHLPVAKRKQLPCDDAYQLMEGLLSVDSGLRFSPDTAASCPWLSSAEC